ncbi:MAG: hypothetical protein IIY21_11600 [Clostridiales bacterium]|nr:hypothetical protein [Clostridiales bacterium]MBQ1574094.1 hypothetical protein [Clostridiales bacterium]
MAEKRMFSKKIVESDAFLDMPLSSQALYFHLCMGADDDGFLNAPKRIMRMLGCTKGDLEILARNRFILFFDSGIVVIKHWRINNNIQKDRYKPTQYIEEMSQLTLKENNAYTWINPQISMLCDTVDTDCIQDGYTLDPQISIDKNRLDKSSIDKKRGGFAKPTLEEIKAYVIDKGYHFDPEAFFSYYESNGWKVGKNPMKSWQSACITWEKRGNNSAPKSKKLSDMSNDQVTPLSAEERQRLKGAIKR